MLKGFKILEQKDVIDGLIEYRNKGALQGVYLGFPNLHEFYTMSLPGVTDWTGFPASGKSEMLIELLTNTSLFYGWKHLLYVPDIGDKNEVIAIIIHKLTGKTFDKRFENSNYISEELMTREIDWVLNHFKILYPETPKSKLTPYQFWDLAAELKKSLGLHTAVIDSWKDMRHNLAPDGTVFSRDDKYLEDVLSYRNTIAEQHKMHFHTVIHPRGGTEKEKDGNRKAPRPDDLKGGSEWWNNGKCMITIHRPDGSTNEVNFIVTKIKPKSVGKVGSPSLFFDRTLNKFYCKDSENKKIYASKEFFKLNATLDIFQENDNTDDDSDVPF